MSSETDNRTSLRIAAVQMDANPASTSDRLERAEWLVLGAAKSGAQLVVLPECFNTGYTFNEKNHTRVEKIDGQTATWLRDTASKHNIHLCGSFMLVEHGDTYNTLLLFAPDGRSWRYDKNYPWGWEKGYFRESRLDSKVTVAKTDLGDIGFLICWDVGHLNLWEMYAGRVDLIVISSCPVDVGHATFQFPDGEQFTLNDMGPRFASASDSVLLAFGDMINQQAAWLRVPVVHSIEYGHIQTDIPMGRRSLMGFVFVAPWMFKYFPQANDMHMSCDLVHECKILNHSGEILTRLYEDDGESFALAEVNLTKSKSTSQGPQPASLIPGTSYFLADVYIPATVKSVYRKGQRQWRHT